MDALLHSTIVIDDEPALADLIATVATELGHPACSVVGRTAFFSNYRPTLECVILDLNMPGFDGIEVIRHLADTDYSGKILLMSGGASYLLDVAKNLAEARGLDVADVLVKPIDLNKLEDTLTKILESKDKLIIRKSVDFDFDSTEMKLAIERNEFVPYYQPKVESRARGLSGFEALVRWIHPKHGVLSPGLFLPKLIKSNLIDDLTFSLLRQIRADISNFEENGEFCSVAINVESENLRNVAFADRIISEIGQDKNAAKRITLEVTENGNTCSLVDALDNLLRLRMNGFGLSIDDFGTGHSTLKLLKELPFSQLKIDKSFVDGIGESRDAEMIVVSTIDLAKRLKMEVVGEGIEQEHQARFLADHGCDQLQGYLFGKPQPFDEIIQTYQMNALHEQRTIA